MKLLALEREGGGAEGRLRPKDLSTKISPKDLSRMKSEFPPGYFPVGPPSPRWVGPGGGGAEVGRKLGKLLFFSVNCIPKKVTQKKYFFPSCQHDTRHRGEGRRGLHGGGKFCTVIISPRKITYGESCTTLGNPNLPPASRTPQRASPCSVQAERFAKQMATESSISSQNLKESAVPDTCPKNLDPQNSVPVASSLPCEHP